MIADIVNFVIATFPNVTFAYIFPDGDVSFHSGGDVYSCYSDGSGLEKNGKRCSEAERRELGFNPKGLSEFIVNG